MDPSFTEISVDQIACHPMRLTELWVDQKLGTNIEQPRVPHLMKPHIQTLHIWSIRFGDASSQQKFKWNRSYWNKALLQVMWLVFINLSALFYHSIATIGFDIVSRSKIQKVILFLT